MGSIRGVSRLWRRGGGTRCDLGLECARALVVKTIIVVLCVGVATWFGRLLIDQSDERTTISFCAGAEAVIPLLATWALLAFLSEAFADTAPVLVVLVTPLLFVRRCIWVRNGEATTGTNICGVSRRRGESSPVLLVAWWSDCPFSQAPYLEVDAGVGKERKWWFHRSVGKSDAREVIRALCTAAKHSTELARGYRTAPRHRLEVVVHPGSEVEP